MKVVLFEGPDKVGKTTMANYLFDTIAFGESSDFSDDFVPLFLGRAFGTHQVFSGERENKLRSFRLMIETNSISKMMKLPDNYVLFIDRFHLSEKVYGQVFKRGYNAANVRMIDAMLEKALLVYMTPKDTCETYEQFKDDATGLIDDLTIDQYAMSVSLFDEAFAESYIPGKVKITVDTQNGKYHEQLVRTEVANYLRG